MGKALLVGTPGDTVNAEEINFFGEDNNATESITQVVATEAATFSGLRANIISGGAGTNTLLFRNNSANGNQTCNRVGAGTLEDAVNTDAVSAGNPFNVTHTDNNTNPVYRSLACNVEFASGHGSFHSCADFNPPAFDVSNGTRYMPINGQTQADGNATEANVQWKVREYTTVEALQVNVTANARTTDTTFTLRINGADQGTVITYGSGVTGIQTVTGMAEALSPGDLVCIKIVYAAADTGVMRVSQCGVTMKSTGSGSEIACGDSAGLARAASATADYYVVGGDIVADATETNQRVKVGFAARCKNLRCYLSANTYGGAGTLKLMVNGVAQITTTIGAGGGAAWYENTSDTFDIDDNDEISFEIDEGTSGSITIHQIGVSLAAIPGGSTYTLDADSASYAYTATAAGVEYGRLIDAAAASYAYTATDATLTRDIPLSADSAAYAWTANDAGLEHGWLLDAASAAYAWTATDAALEYTPVGSTYTLDADGAAYLWSATDAGLTYVSLARAPLTYGAGRLDPARVRAKYEEIEAIERRIEAKEAAERESVRKQEEAKRQLAELEEKKRQTKTILERRRKLEARIEAYQSEIFGLRDAVVAMLEEIERARADFEQQQILQQTIADRRLRMLLLIAASA